MPAKYNISRRALTVEMNTNLSVNAGAGGDHEDTIAKGTPGHTFK